LPAEIIIVGGGVIGAVTALALAKNNINTILIEQREVATILNKQSDGRAFAISGGSWNILHSYGLTDNLIAHAGKLEQIRVSDNDSLLHIHFDNKQVEGKPFGYMIQHDILLKELYKLVQDNSKIKLFDNSNYDQVIIDNYEANININGTGHLAKLLIAADGKNSRLRKIIGIDIKELHYDQVAIVCNVSHEKDHHNIAQERFLPAGPFAVLPLIGGKSSSIVWTEKKKLAPIYLSMQPDEFLYHLQQRFTGYLGNIKLISKIYSYPISLTFADSYYSQRLALVGDAAHSIHPIAGQGLNMGIRDIEQLVDLIIEQQKLGLDVGSTLLLENYQKARSHDNMALIATTDILNRLFSNNILPVAIARRLGIAAVNKIPQVKKFFIQYAMGIRD
jgi:2-octaprenyl-6-methoxyphenol hydroxylase